jgi:hypothetical protein
MAGSDDMRRGWRADLPESAKSGQAGAAVPDAPEGVFSALEPEGPLARGARGHGEDAGCVAGAPEMELAKLFAPDLVLPEQFLPRPERWPTGVKRLMVAVLEDAIRCFQGHLRNPRLRPDQLSREAERWIRTRGDDGTFSFTNVCGVLGIDADGLRSLLLGWKSRFRAAAGGGGGVGQVKDKLYRRHVRAGRSNVPILALAPGGRGDLRRSGGRS